MPAQWTADVIGKMHVKGIRAKELSTHMGLNPKYVSAVLNGHRCPKGAEARFRIALTEIISQRETASQATTCQKLV